MVEYNDQQLGNYRLVRRLGRGGAAEVYLGEHIFLNTQAAIKILQAPLPEQDVPAFLREARTIAGLTHPNIVRVLDFGVQDETFYLVMEYAPRGTLRQSYPPGTLLDQRIVVELVKLVAGALQYAHDQNIIHCDVKPENMLLGKDNAVLLSDFGISMVLQTMTAQEAQHIAGTIAYMAPEQFDGKPQRASDQYALAVIAYEWLCGERPFQGNVAAISSQHLHAQAALLSGKVPGIAPEVDAALGVAMEKDPARRFGSILAFARALEQACGRAPAQTPDFAKEGPTWQATITPAPIPLPTPPNLARPHQHLDMTIASDHMPAIEHDTDPQRFSDVYHPQAEQAGRFQPEPVFQPDRRTPGRDTSRRAFLLGTGAGVVMVGAVVVLAASGKLATLFAHGSTISTPVTGKHTMPRATAGQTPAQSTTTSNLLPGTTLTTYAGQSSDVTGICWSPVLSSRMVASCSQDKSVAIWSATTGDPARSFSQSAPLSTVVWSPDGQYLAFAGDASSVEVRDATNGGLVSTCTGHTQPIRGLAWSPDSQRLVSTSDDHTAIVWNALSGNQLLAYTNHTDKVWVAAWAPNSSAIATGSWDSSVQIWDPNSGSRIMSYSATQPVRAVDWSPDSHMLASGGDDNSVQVWQAANGQVLATYRGHSDHIEAVQWSPNGQRIASASKDGTAQIWQALNANPFYTYRGHSTLIWTLAWSPDGQLIATGSADHTAKVWQAV